MTQRRFGGAFLYFVSAFENCTSLRKINLSGDIQFIDQHTFDGCDEALVIVVRQDSVAMQFCLDHGIHYDIAG